MITKDLEESLQKATDEAARRRHEYVTLEHLLFALLDNSTGIEVLLNCGADVNRLRSELETFLQNSLQVVPGTAPVSPVPTAAYRRLLESAILHAATSSQREINAGHLIIALFEAKSSHAVFLLESQAIRKLDVLAYVSHGISKIAEPEIELTGGDEEQGSSMPRDPLAAFAVDLVDRAAKGEIDPLIGRGPELERTVQVLCRRRKNNPLFVGEPGVGKTAIAEGLALKIHNGEVPEVLREARIYALDMGAVLAGTKYRGEFEQRFKGVLNALAKKKDAILFIDEIHTIVGAGAVSGGSMDASNIIKPALASGKVRCIGSTTYVEYKASFERDRALARRFQRIEVGEPTVEETVRILEGLKSYYEEHHGVKFSPEAIRLAADLAARYIHERHLPDKAIDVLDEAGARVRMMPAESRPVEIGVAEIELVVSRMAKIPPKTIGGSERDRLQHLDSDLRKVIFGQDRAIDQIVRAIKVSRSGLGSPDKPIGSFLFSGPTGVGKTELARQLAQSLGNELVRFDMSEYAEPHTVSRLIGAPPGYVGFDQGGLLTDAITRTPYAVVVLDEIEKAHPNLFNILLQVMDHATLTDNNGKKADFRNVVLIMTTNAGAREMSEAGMGFQRTDASKGKGRGAIERMFSPEFRNRLDAWIAFEPLGIDSILLVVDKFVQELRVQLADKRVDLSMTSEGRQWLAGHGYDGLYGARPMARLIQSKIKEPLVDEILFGRLASGGTVVVDAAENELRIDVHGESIEPKQAEMVN